MTSRRVSRRRVPSKLPRQQRGVALLATLILMLAVTLVLGNIFYRHQMDVSQATGSLHGDQAILLAMSGESWARDLLASANDDLTVDNFDEDWAQAVPLLPVDGGTLAGCIVDLQSQINLNNYGTYTDKRLSDERASTAMGYAKLWDNVLTLLDIPVDASNVAVLVDWLDSDSELVNSAGAEQPDYSRFTPPRFPPNSAISDTAELAAMVGYRLTDVQQLMPWIVALPAPTAININTAPEPILLALSDGLAREFVDLVRDNRPFMTTADFYQLMADYLVVPQDEVKQRWPETLIDVKSTFFQLNLEVTLGQARLEVKSVLDRTDRSAPIVISREITVVPAGVATVTSASDLTEDDNPDADDSAGRQYDDDSPWKNKNAYLRPLCDFSDRQQDNNLGAL